MQFQKFYCAAHLCNMKRLAYIRTLIIVIITAMR